MYIKWLLREDSNKHCFNVTGKTIIMSMRNESDTQKRVWVGETIHAFFTATSNIEIEDSITTHLWQHYNTYDCAQRIIVSTTEKWQNYLWYSGCDRGWSLTLASNPFLCSEHSSISQRQSSDMFACSVWCIHQTGRRFTGDLSLFIPPCTPYLLINWKTGSEKRKMQNTF